MRGLAFVFAVAGGRAGARGRSTPDECLFFASGCKIAGDMCGGIEHMLAVVEADACVDFVHGIGMAARACDEATDNYVYCLYSHLPQQQCHEVCDDGARGEAALEACTTRCLHFKVCSTQCRASDGKTAVEGCFESCFASAHFWHEDTCVDRCGQHSSNFHCHCDEPCLYNNDCCADYQASCVPDAVGDVLAAPTGAPPTQPPTFLRSSAGAAAAAATAAHAARIDATESIWDGAQAEAVRAEFAHDVGKLEDFAVQKTGRVTLPWRKA